MTMYYTRKESEINRRKIYDYISNCLNNQVFKFSYNSDFISFKNMICKYNKNYIWFECFIDGEKLYAPYYDIKEKKLNRLLYFFEENIEQKDIKFEERKTTYEKIKDKIETKKATFK